MKVLFKYKRPLYLTLNFNDEDLKNPFIYTYELKKLFSSNPVDRM